MAERSVGSETSNNLPTREQGLEFIAQRKEQLRRENPKAYEALLNLEEANEKEELEYARGYYDAEARDELTSKTEIAIEEAYEVPDLLVQNAYLKALSAHRGEDMTKLILDDIIQNPDMFRSLTFNELANLLAAYDYDFNKPIRG